MVGAMYWNNRLKCFYCKVDGRQTRLSPDESIAKILYSQTIADNGEIKDPNVSDVVGIYLKKCIVEPSTLARKTEVLATLVKLFGGKQARNLGASDIELWLATQYPNIGPTTKRDRIAEVQAAWKFGMESGLITTNKIAHIRKPTALQREHYIPAVKWQKYLDAICNEQFRLLFEFGLYTGARAQEVLILTCEDWAGGRFTLPKTRAKGRRRSRTILVPPPLQPKIEAEVEKWQTGHVFRNTRGIPWNKSSINCSMKILKKKLNDPKLCYTSLRHSYATSKLDSGVAIEVVAQLMGHSSTKMVYERYGHWAKMDSLVAAAAIF